MKWIHLVYLLQNNSVGQFVENCIEQKQMAPKRERQRYHLEHQSQIISVPCDTFGLNLIFSCNLQRNSVSSRLLQEKSPPVTLLVYKIIRPQVIQQLAYVYNSTGACNIFFTQICVPSCKKKLPRVTWPLISINYLEYWGLKKTCNMAYISTSHKMSECKQKDG